MGEVAAVLNAWLAVDESADRIVHVERSEPEPAVYAHLEAPLAAVAVDGLEQAGISRLYRHQVDALDHIRAGRHTVLVSGTASGKSLAYQLPILEQLDAKPDATALLMFPTKALARDQLHSFDRLSSLEIEAGAYDGDADPAARSRIRDRARVVVTNPDMLHYGMLPHHVRWRRFLGNLELVAVDELHAFRGVFGSHVAQILRRLRRLARHYGADPVFVFTSATVGNPGDLATRLTGLDVTVIDDDTSARGARTVVLWNPELEDPERGIRSSPLTDGTRAFVDLLKDDIRTIVFTRSRKASELMLRWTRERLDTAKSDRVAAYRSGYLPAERRRIEQALFSGELLGITATNALELGIDVGGLDACVLTTFPGTVASFRQQVGRAGRTRDDALAVLIAGQDALDQYYMTHPDDLFGRSSEAAVINPANPDIMSAHLACAAHELPIESSDVTFFGHELEERAAEMESDGRLGVREGRLFWAGGGSPSRDIDIRTSGGRGYRIYSAEGDQIGTVDEGRAFTQCHPGAVYLHQGEGFVVERLDQDLREVWVRAEEATYYTEPQVEKDLSVRRTHETRPSGRITVHHGDVEVSSHVLGYRRKDIATRRLIDETPLDLPERVLRTTAVWYTFEPAVYEEAAIGWQDLPGVLHAAEHTAIAVLPLFAVCDRWDIGGLSTALSQQLGEPVFFIYDGYPGGAGIAPIAFEQAERHLRATLDVLSLCPCRDGCPSCVQSPKCGNFNEPLDRHGAAALLRTALSS
jgi:DEAD/DEAH box helicase domain-containing protein